MARRDSWVRNLAMPFVALASITIVVAGCANDTRTAVPVATEREASTSSSSSTILATSAVPATPSLPDAFTTGFQQFADSVPGKVGLAVAGVGDQPVIGPLGEWHTGPAWSTIKVPLSIAALRETDPPSVTDDMIAAITHSDNAAADAIWQSLGPPTVAAQKVEDVLQDAGAPTVVRSDRVRPGYSAFGQTTWSLTDEARFLSSVTCTAFDKGVLDLMGKVEGSQRWGLGNVDGARIKGGWGPEPDGGYIVRQIAIIPTPHGMTAVAVAAKPKSGSFDEGTEILTELATWLTAQSSELPAGQCPS